MLLREKFLYRYNKKVELKKGPKHYWYCTKKDSKGCKAAAHLDSNGVVLRVDTEKHNHKPNELEVKLYKFKMELAKLAVERRDQCSFRDFRSTNLEILCEAARICELDASKFKKTPTIKCCKKCCTPTDTEMPYIESIFRFIRRVRER